MRIGTLFYTTILFFCPAEEFHGIPDKNRDFSIQFFCPGYISLLNIVASPSYTEYHWGTLIAL